ncbi:unnamed protein product, partial [marine sediment metagenome]
MSVFVDLTGEFDYGDLAAWQRMDELAHNDDFFNDLLTGAQDIDNNLNFNNAKYIRGEVFATGAWKNLIGLDGSDVCQVGVAGTEVHLPQDPVSALGAVTKQMLEAATMFQFQAIASGSEGLSGSLLTILNIASGKGIIHGIYAKKATTNGTLRIKITIDGSANIDDTSGDIPINDIGVMTPYGTMEDTDYADLEVAIKAGVPFLIHIPYNASIKVEAAGG